MTCDTKAEPRAPCVVAADGSGTYTSLQDAVDAASEGDVITVCPGYYDPVVIDRVGVSLVGSGADSTCIIGSDWWGPAVWLEGVEVTLSDVTLSGTDADHVALHALGASGTIERVRIAGVQPGAAGTSVSAALADGCSLTWESVTIEQNSVATGLGLQEGTHFIRHSVFRDNITAVGASGDSISQTSIALELTNCVFTGNRQSAMEVDHATGIIANNLFYENFLGLNGPMHVGDLGNPLAQVRNNAAVSNAASGFTMVGDSNYNVTWRNGEEGVAPESSGGAHNFDADPLFEDPEAGDFRLQSTSPLIDAGDGHSQYDDADGTTNDIGLFGGPYGDWSPP